VTDHESIWYISRDIGRGRDRSSSLRKDLDTWKGGGG